MTPVDQWIPASLVMLLLGCPCESSEALVTDAASSDSSSTGESIDPHLDASRWIGRYHYEDAWLEFGERGDPIGAPMLINFEVRADGTATMFYEGCADWPAIVIAYRWELGEDGWLHLYPGEGESRLRFMAADDVGTLRAYLGEPCEERLLFEADGRIQAWLDFFPGESCWVDRCTSPDILRIDYCEGEEPPPCP